MIKVEQTQYTHQAMRAIGSGFQSVLFADIRTVEDAEACVAAVRAETPGTRRRGSASACGAMSARCCEGGSPAYVEALNEVVIAIMVEKRECVEDLEAILSVQGIDMVQFGAVRLLDEPRPDRPAQPPGRGEGGAQDHRDGAEDGHAPARGTGRHQSRRRPTSRWA